LQIIKKGKEILKIESPIMSHIIITLLSPQFNQLSKNKISKNKHNSILSKIYDYNLLIRHYGFKKNIYASRVVGDIAATIYKM
jgi:hypothetical protein